MSQHPSLRSKQKSKKHRSVIKRFERVRELKEKEKWKDGESVFGLLKLKILRFKLKKEKGEPAALEAQAAGEGAPEAAQAATQDTAKTPGQKKEGKEGPVKKEKKEQKK